MSQIRIDILRWIRDQPAKTNMVYHIPQEIVDEYGENDVADERASLISEGLVEQVLNIWVDPEGITRITLKGKRKLGILEEGFKDQLVDHAKKKAPEWVFAALKWGMAIEIGYLARLLTSG